ncbi:MAG: GIY-YIG nuclease family protein [Clostridia bacterium]|nr:GIY-YIG nuclease family protein [Clostridia bacterium]
MAYFAYILRCSDGTFYSGYTTDPERREKVHNEGKGAKYTRSRRPVRIVYCESFEQRSDAMKREAALKKLSHEEKERLTKER